MTMAPERRRQRSNDPLVALHYQLSHAKQEGRLEAIVVADDEGLVVAAAGAWAMCEELAAYAPLLAHGAWTPPATAAGSRVAEVRPEIDVHAVDVEGQTVLLCARGGPSRPATLGRAAQGVARILRRPAPALGAS